jgi:hypothetical protein
VRALGRGTLGIALTSDRDRIVARDNRRLAIGPTSPAERSASGARSDSRPRQAAGQPSISRMVL